MPVPLARDSHAETRVWRLLPQAGDSPAKLTGLFGIHAAVARVLSARGWSADERTREFLAPDLKSIRDPFTLRDMERGVERVLQARDRGERLLVFGDYDADGITSSAILMETLRFLKMEPEVFLPHRIDDGYGVHAGQMDDFAARGIKLIVTVDTGITAVEAIARANALGMDVVITDHHLAQAEIPAAFAVINPNLPGAEYAGGPLCGAGTAFKFAHAMLKKSGVDATTCKEFLRDLLDLVAIGTVADCVPLWGENRVFARHGLERLAKSTRPGVMALRSMAKIAETDRLTCQHVGFSLAPRINATGRLNHPEKAFELLTTRNAKRAQELAEELEQLNRDRRKEELRILEHALLQVDALREEHGHEHGYVVEGADYHLGVVGIVAARISEKHYRPSVVLKREDSRMKGSARSIPGLDVHEIILQCGSMLTRYGGHAQAAGLELLPEQLVPFRERFNTLCKEQFESDRAYAPTLDIDAELAPGEFGWDLQKSLQRLEPFGQDNTEPLFLMEQVECVGAPRLVGQNHLKLNLRHGSSQFAGIGFNKGEYLPNCEHGSRVNLVVRIKENEWQGRVSLEVEIVDLRVG